MDPFLGPVAGALLAALGAGGALGIVRLRRISLDWWRRRRSARAAARLGGGEAAPPASAPVTAAPDEARDSALAPPVFAALGAVALVAATVAGVALVLGAAQAPPPPPPLLLALPHPPRAPASLGAFAARSSALIAFAVLAAAATLGLALVASALDRGLGRLIGLVARRLGHGGRGGTEEERLAVPDLVAAGRALLPGATPPVQGEPFGVGLAYVALLAAATLGVGALLAAAGAGDRRTLPGFAALAAAGLLAVPVVYAAAAERSRDPLRARLRRDAAVRQLVVAPGWMLAGAVFVLAPGGPAPALVAAVALLVLAVTVAVALPGAGADPGAWSAPPRGGDRAEPAAAVRALTALAHYAWIAVAALLPFVLRARSAAELPAAIGAGLGALVAFLAARAALRRFLPAGAPPPAAPRGEAPA
jgi:hypothetical protein